MKLEANKYYRTRDGRKAYVAAIAPDEIKANYPLIGLIIYLNDDLYPATWDTKGFSIGESEPDDEDLISEWIDEPEKKEAKWLYVQRAIVKAHPDGVGQIAGYIITDERNEYTIGRTRLEPME
jgi:hypothetical protein